MDTNITGRRIKERREDIGLTQEELANLSGYTNKATISQIEAGKIKPSYKKIFALSKALNCDVSFLLGTNINPAIIKYAEAVYDHIIEDKPPESGPSYKITQQAAEVIRLMNNLPENEQWKLVGRIEAYVEGLSKVLNKGEPNEKV